MNRITMKKFKLFTASAVVLVMLFGTTGVYATDTENGVKDILNALSTKVQQIEM